MAEGRGDDDRRRDPGRVEAFTDGVFAIVITILVLEIAVPPNLDKDSFRATLEELRPTFVAWVISFLLTGMYWVMHRDLFARIRYVNRDLVWLNILFLLPASLIPFASSVLGEYPDEPTALHLYGLVMVAATTMRSVLYLYVARRPSLLWERPASRRVGVGLAIAAAPLPVYALAMALAGVATTVSVVLYFAVPGLYFLLISLLRDRPRTRQEAEEFS
jgi:uncharacterized membrane protein